MRKIPVLALALLALAALLSVASAAGLGNIALEQGDFVWHDAEDEIYIHLAPFGDPQVGKLTSARSFTAGRLEDYSELKQSLSGEPTWSIAPVGTVAANIGISTGEHGEFLLELNSLPSTETEETWTITCSWGGATASKTARLLFRNCKSTIELNAPKNLTFFSGEMIYLPSAWDLDTEDFYGHMGYSFSQPDFVTERVVSYDDYPDEPYTELYGNLYGRGTGTIIYGYGNLRTAWPVTVRVCDLDGVVPGQEDLITPDNLTRIDAQALEKTDFEYIVIGENVTSIESRAFADMSNLKEVVFLNGDTAVPADLFGDIDPKDAPVIVHVRED